MNFSDYEAVWKRQDVPLRAAADVAQIKADFASKSRKMAAVLFARDLLEAGAGVVVGIAFVCIWRKLGSEGWPVGVAMALVLGVSGVFIRERFRVRRLRLSPAAPLLEKVAADLAELRHQRRLFLNMWAWYLGPVFVAILLVHVAFYLQAEPWAAEAQRDPLFCAGFLVFYLALFGLAWANNRHVVRRQLEPRLAELEKLHRDLLSTD